MLGLILLGCAWLFSNSFVLTATQLFCLLYTSHRLAPRLFPSHPPLAAIFLTFGVFLGLQSIFQACFYYLSIPLNLETDAGSQALTIAILHGVHLFIPASPARDETSPEKTRLVWAAISVLMSGVTAALLLWHAQQVATTEAIRTPWNLLPADAILGFTLIPFASWLSAWRSRSAEIAWILVSVFFITLALITAYVYPLGFGFDGFLHRASEQILTTTGVLTPKPPYYIGQYVLVGWLARTFSWPIGVVDTFLLASCLPLLAAALSRKTSRSLMFLAVLPFLIPLRPWIVTTPQSLAYLIGLVGLFLAYTLEKPATFFPSLIFGLWAAVIHPLAGLPLLGGIALILWYKHISHKGLRVAGSFLLMAGSALVVPLAFFINSQHSSAQVEWRLASLLSLPTWQQIADFFAWPSLRISLWADWSAFVEYLFPFVLCLAAIVGVRKTWKDKDILWLSVTAVLLMVTAWCLQHAAVFTFLINYERQDYAQRLLLVGQLFLLPAALQGLVVAWDKVRQLSIFGFCAFLLGLAAWQGARIYHAFPYHDATHIEHGWNVSAADKEAVRWIERDSRGKPYTVLANQSVSAAAVAELGFKRYAGEVFFYPIPTGGPLYQTFLRVASTEGSLEDIQTAAQLGESERVYVVLNNYWWQFEEVSQRLKKIAEATYEIQDGTIRVYRFGINNDKKR